MPYTYPEKFMRDNVVAPFFITIRCRCHSRLIRRLLATVFFLSLWQNNFMGERTILTKSS